jgi:ASC-1-like (ASCH) protein
MLKVKTETMQSVLHLNLRRKYFADIAAGTKRIEYRDRKSYWKKRLEGRQYDVIKFRNGYATNAPEMLVECCGVRERGRNYEILLERILKIKCWKP